MKRSADVLNEEEKAQQREILSRGGFTLKNVEDIAESARQNSTMGRVGLGFSGGGSGGGGYHAPPSMHSTPAMRGENIQLKAAAHYNNRNDTHRRLDSTSDTLQQKNLNNWIKSLLIKSAVLPGFSVLDFACGKGGDLPKWSKQEIGHYVGIDIAHMSVQDAIGRYNGTKERPTNCKFPTIWCVGNFVRPDLLDKLLEEKKGIHFDLVSCQFAIHYSWTSEADAKAALMNAAKRLRPGGLFVGTTTDAYVMKKKLDKAQGSSFGNSLYNVEFINPDGPDGNPLPEPFDKTFANRSPFGLKYRFYLKDAVDDCEECLVHFPTFKKLGEECGLKLVEHMNFIDFVERALAKSSKKAENLELLKGMRVLERGTISNDQWEVAHLYKTFVFKKMPDKDFKFEWNKPEVKHRMVSSEDLLVLTCD